MEVVNCNNCLARRKVNTLLLISALLIFIAGPINARRHTLVLKDDARKNIQLSTFGFLKNGVLMVNVSGFAYKNSTAGSLAPKDQDSNFVFSLEKTSSDGAAAYLQTTSQCILDTAKIPDALSLLLFTFNLNARTITVKRYATEFQNISISSHALPNKALPVMEYIKSLVPPYGLLSKTDAKKRNLMPGAAPISKNKLHLNRWKKNGKDFYSGVITIAVRDEAEEGLYNLYFQSCANFQIRKAISMEMNVNIIEVNDHTYLSAGERHLPVVFGLMSLLFFVTGCVYFSFLKKHRELTFKIHYLMASLVFLKSIALVFHASNFYYIGQDGSPVESWAVLYYVTHLLKGALLFTTIVLIGTGFFFVKHVLSSKEKHVFMIIIPLQIISNVARIMIESTEEGTVQYVTWKQMFILLDLICCGAILFPIVWSIRHLQDAAKTDGKAAISLAKLQLFRHFYVMIVCYIYFTRIIVYLIKITVPFQYMWLDEFFTEMATYLFFVVTGYKFRPAPTNPYLHVPEEDEEDDIEMDEITTETGMTQGLVRKGNRKIIET